MKKTVINLFVLALVTSFAFADGAFVQSGVAPPYIVDGDTLFGGMPYDAGRGILGGTDLDGDMKQEVWITSYENGGQVFCFEEAGTDTLAFVWASAENTADWQGPRDIHTGDLDGDGMGEIIFHIGRWTGETNPDAGLHVYEWDGTDNGYGTEAAFQVNLYDALNDSLNESRVEGFSVGDIDSDGQDEILLANNGSGASFGTQDGSTPYHGDRFIIMSVSGGIGDFGTTIVEEYSMSPRDVDKDGVTDNLLGGGSPQDMVMSDIDGDSLLEAACFSWNNLAVFFIEATDTNAYTIGDTTFLKLTPGDDWTLGASVADMDMDGKDEVYVSGYGDGSLFVITDADGDATSLDQTGTAADDWAGNTEVAVIGSNSLGMAAVEEGAVFSGGLPGNDVKMWKLTAGGSALDITDWTESHYAITDPTATGSVLKMDAGWGDDDETLLVLLAYKGVADSVDVGGVMTLDPAGNRVFRLAEWDGTIMTVRNITTIMPDDYKLAQNFPNPFNPTTRIEYYLPMNNTISLTIYNMLGQEIVKLVNNKYTVGGSHFIVWNGTDKNGMKVGSGTYVYELRYGNFSKTRQMTLIK